MQEKLENKAFTLVMLGTATNFYPKLKQAKKPKRLGVGDVAADYPKGETLSIIASLINPEGATVALDSKNPIPYQGRDVAVVNGPNNRGSLVGEKIAHGLAASLKAVAQGKTTLNIIAHSRGAVESVLIAHELEAVQKMMSSCTPEALEQLSLNEVLNNLAAQQQARYANSVKNNTPNIIPVLKASLTQLSLDEFAVLKRQLAKLELNFFGIDPVPGDVFPITWYDERYFTLPAIVKKAQIIYYENERSDWGFSPLFIEQTPGADQELIRLTMPGHHGTGSAGNGASQRNTVLSAAEVKTSHVQKLMIFKLLDFLNQHGTVFAPNPSIFADSGHHALGKKLARAHCPKPLAEGEPVEIRLLNFKAIYEELYVKIVSHRDGYRAFNKSCYWLMGVLTSGRRLLYKDSKAKPSTGHAYRALADSFPLEVDYINSEHGFLMQESFFKLFGLSTLTRSDISATELLKKAADVLEAKIRAANELTKAELDYDFARTETPFDLLAARADVVKTFQIVIQQVSQQYLNEDWNSEAKRLEKEGLFKEIINTLAIFDTVKKALVNKKALSGKAAVNIDSWCGFIDDLQRAGLTEITKTIDRKHKELLSACTRLQLPVDEQLVFFFSQIVKSLQQEEPAGEREQEAADADIIAEIKTILSAAEYQALTNYPIDAKLQFIWEKLITNHPQLRPDEGSHAERLKESFEEQFADSLDDFALLYQQIQIFIDDLGGLRSNQVSNDAAVLERCELSLLQQSKALVATAAQRFFKERAASLPADKLSTEPFAQLAEHYAVHHLGLADRVQTRLGALEGQLNQLAQQLTSELSAKQALELELATEKAQVIVLKQDLASESSAKKELETALATEQAKVSELNQQLTSETSAKQALAAELATEQARVTELTQQVQALGLELATEKAQLSALRQNLTSEGAAKQTPAAELVTETAQVIELKQQLASETAAKQALTTELVTTSARAAELSQQLEAEARAKKQTEDDLALEKTRAAQQRHKIYNDKQEARFLLLIDEKLQPLTKAYYDSLHASKDRGALRASKIAHLESLLQCLNDTERRAKPSERVRAFYTQLDAVAQELKAHRDGDFVRFIRNALLVAGVLISGIIPGLLALAAYRTMTNNALSSCFFWESRGTLVERKLKALQPKLDNEESLVLGEHSNEHGSAAAKP